MRHSDLWLALGNISIFWKYRDISFDNISYRGNFSISKYRISILIVFIIFMYATHEVYGLDISTELSNETKISDYHLF